MSEDEEDELLIRIFGILLYCLIKMIYNLTKNIIEIC